MVLLAIGTSGLVMSLALLALRIEPVTTLFYPLAWWSYIFLINGAIQLLAKNKFSPNNSVPAFTNGSNWILMASFSFVFWLFFEALNIRLDNWKYTGIPSETFIRWPGTFMAFATVLPAIFSTAAFAVVIASIAKQSYALGLPRSPRRPRNDRPWKFTSKILTICQIGGIVTLILPIIWPGLFFPLVWGSVFFILDPINYRYGYPSLFKDIEQGTLNRIVSLLLSGLVCGLLWESFNYWAGAKWTYVLPQITGPKAFEMPLLGYLGFPPFALECFAAWSLFAAKWEKINLRGKSTVAFAGAVFSFIVLHAIDKYTVISYKSILP